MRVSRQKYIILWYKIELKLTLIVIKLYSQVQNKWEDHRLNEGGGGWASSILKTIKQGGGGWKQIEKLINGVGGRMCPSTFQN